MKTAQPQTIPSNSTPLCPPTTEETGPTPAAAIPPIAAAPTASAPIYANAAGVLAQAQEEQAFPETLRDALYHTIFSRRDVRGQFKPDPVPEAVLSRLLTAAHFAPSVGFMQPWSFLLLRDRQRRQGIHDLFAQANEEARTRFGGDQGRLYSRLKLEGILESPLNLVITCDRDRAGPEVLGRTHIPTMDLFSTVCAVQNLWLAARAEGLGVGWVSIFDPERVHAHLGLPPRVEVVAYLCLGYVRHFESQPELETLGWRRRLDLGALVYEDAWGQAASASLQTQLRQDQARAAAERRL